MVVALVIVLPLVTSFNKTKATVMMMMMMMMMMIMMMITKRMKEARIQIGKPLPTTYTYTTW